MFPCVSFVTLTSRKLTNVSLMSAVNLIVSWNEFKACKKDWLVVLRLNVPVNNFSVMSGRSHRFLGN